MAQAALAPTRVKTVGESTRLFFGCAGGSGTSTVVTLPGNVTVINVIVGGATSTTAVYCDTISTNTFTVTHAASDLFTYIAITKGGV